MPLSEKKLAANRANAVKSHGPITLEGKRNSSRNGIRHGILANSVLIEGESRERFAELLNAMETEHEPATPTERTLVERMAVSQWRLSRLWALDSAGITLEMRRQSASTVDHDPPTRAMLAMRAMSDSGRHVDLMSRYEHRFDRQYYRALDALTKLREKRRPPTSPTAPGFGPNVGPNTDQASVAPCIDDTPTSAPAATAETSEADKPLIVVEPDIDTDTDTATDEGSGTVACDGDENETSGPPVSAAPTAAPNADEASKTPATPIRDESHEKNAGAIRSHQLDENKQPGQTDDPTAGPPDPREDPSEDPTMDPTI